MCTGMFMAILDVPVVATSLPTIQSAVAILPDQMSWVRTASHFGSYRDPVDRLLYARTEYALAVRVYVGSQVILNN
jgi:hypothetical protein